MINSLDHELIDLAQLHRLETDRLARQHSAGPLQAALDLVELVVAIGEYAALIQTDPFTALGQARQFGQELAERQGAEYVEALLASPAATAVLDGILWLNRRIWKESVLAGARAMSPA